MISNSELNEMIMALHKAVELDRNFFVKATIDPMFDDFRSQINYFLDEMFQEKRRDVLIKISNVESDMQKIKKWFDEGYASPDDIQRYNSIYARISEAKHKSKLQSFFDCDDSLQIVSNAKDEINSIKLLIRTNLSKLESERESRKKEFEDIPNQISNTLRSKNKKQFEGFLMTSGGILVALILIYIIFSGILGIIGSIIDFLILLCLGIVLPVIILGGFLQFVQPYEEGEAKPKDVVKWLKNKKKNLTEQISALDKKITIAKESLI